LKQGFGREIIGRASIKMLEKTGIGLILFHLEKGRLGGIEKVIASKDHKVPVERYI